jgi:hypothetical protein
VRHGYTLRGARPDVLGLPGFDVVAHCDTTDVAPRGTLVTTSIDDAVDANAVGRACGRVEGRTVSGTALQSTHTIFAHATFQALSSTVCPDGTFEGLVSRRSLTNTEGNFHLAYDDQCAPALFDRSQRFGTPPLLDGLLHDVSFSVGEQGLNVVAVVDGLQVGQVGGGEPFAMAPSMSPGPLYIGDDPNPSSEATSSPRPATLVDEVFAGTTPRTAEWLQAFHAGVRGFVATRSPPAPPADFVELTLGPAASVAFQVPGGAARVRVDIRIDSRGKTGKHTFSVGLANAVGFTCDLNAGAGTTLSTLPAVPTLSTSHTAAGCSETESFEFVVDDSSWWASTTVPGPWDGRSAGVLGDGTRDLSVVANGVVITVEKIAITPL